MNKIRVNLRVTEIDTLSDALVRLYKDAAKDEAGALAKDANLAEIMAEVERLSAEITTAIKGDKVTSALDEADVARDEIVRSLDDALTGYAAIPVPAKKAAAQSLLAVFAKYGRQITAKSYAEESSLIESMLEDFGAESLKSDAAALDGIGELIASLRAAQDAFNKASDDYTAAKTGKGESATAIKKTLLGVMNNQLVPYLSAVGALPAYKDFTAKAEGEVDRANAAARGRSAGK